MYDDRSTTDRLKAAVLGSVLGRIIVGASLLGVGVSSLCVAGGNDAIHSVAGGSGAGCLAATVIYAASFLPWDDM